MANPLLSVRIPVDLDELLPNERGARSKVVIEALRAYLQPSDEQGKLAKRVADLERLIPILRGDLEKLKEQQSQN